MTGDRRAANCVYFVVPQCGGKELLSRGGKELLCRGGKELFSRGGKELLGWSTLHAVFTAKVGELLVTFGSYSLFYFFVD